MENSKKRNSSEGDSPEALPSLIQAITALEVAGFDRDRDANSLHCLSNLSFGIEADTNMDVTDLSKHRRKQSISISMPSSPVETHNSNTKKVIFRDDDTAGDNEISCSSAAYDKFRTQRKAKCYSQPMPKGSTLNEVVKSANFPILPPSYPRSDKITRDNRFDSFKTWSGKLERQLSVLRGKRKETEQDPNPVQPPEVETLPVARYFDALEGPELDTLRDTEESVLPDDKTWPFLLRFPISSFGICLGVSSQAIMWKTLASVNSSKFLHIPKDINLFLWLISVALVVIISITYILKVIFYFEAVRREYYHPIRINFFFAPWIALLFLALGVPPSITTTLHESLWYILMFPFLCLELKIYGQWMSGGQRRLSKVATPVNHLSVVGNFVGALLGASMGLKEGPLFFFAIGLAHYTVLFVTLYQRLPSNETLPKELHPVFFLFVAAPSVASMAWARIQGSFDYGSRIAYFIAMFLYFSLAVRINFFRGIRFSLTWWAYTFPMTGAAIATIRYSDAVTNTVTKTLAVLLCMVATLTVAALLVTTIIYAFVLKDLFPNDIAIAISDRKPITPPKWYPITHRKWYHRRGGSADASIEQYLKYACSDGKDVEAGVSPSTVTTVSNSECSHCGAKDVQKPSPLVSDRK